MENSKPKQLPPVLKRSRSCEKIQDRHGDGLAESTVFSQEITLPSAHSLTRNLQFFNHLLDSTELIKTIGDKKLAPSSVLFYVDLAIYDQLEMLKKSKRTKTDLLIHHARIERYRRSILQAIFVNHPDITQAILGTGYAKAQLRDKIDVNNFLTFYH